MAICQRAPFQANFPALSNMAGINRKPLGGLELHGDGILWLWVSPAYLKNSRGMVKLVELWFQSRNSMIYWEQGLLAFSFPLASFPLPSSIACFCFHSSLLLTSARRVLHSFSCPKFPLPLAFLPSRPSASQFWNGCLLPSGCTGLKRPWQLHSFGFWCLNLRPQVHLQIRLAHPQSKAHWVEFSRDLATKI